MKNISDEEPDELSGLCDLLPAEILMKLNELLELMHRSANERQDASRNGNVIEINIYKSGSQRVDCIQNQYVNGTDQPLPGKGGENGKGSVMPEVLSTEAAMELWQKVLEAGYVDERYQPTISRTQSAILADEMSVQLSIKNKWKAFETLWNRRNMYRDYHDALDQRQSLQFRDTLRALFR